MTADSTTALSRQNHDLQNQAIKSLFNQQIHSNSNNLHAGHTPELVHMVKVREAWAALPEEPIEVASKISSEDVVRRIPLQMNSSGTKVDSERLRKNEAENLERDLNDAINNNGNEEEAENRTTNEEEVRVNNKFFVTNIQNES